jgi:hypothetical protein
VEAEVNPKLTLEEEAAFRSLARCQRLSRIDQAGSGRSPVAFAVPNHKKELSLRNPIDLVKKRAELPNITWHVPGVAERQVSQDQAAGKDVKISSELAYKTVSKFRSKVEVETDLINGYWGLYGIVYPEYDLLEPFVILDTEAYFKQAIERKLSLMFREGFSVVGENASWVDYIERRLNQIAYVTETSINILFRDILWNLLICSNCILVKIRNEDASGGRASEKNGNMPPVAGYVICPPHTIFPFMDGNGKIMKWRRFFGDARPLRDYDVEDVVHFFWKRKPGHIFGTPDSAAVRDDIFALRRIEENVELLVAQCLFPFIHLKVGTPDAPAEIEPNGMSEVELYRQEVESMPKEGVLVTDERVEVEVHNLNGGAPYADIIQHYKNRVFTGLGVSAVDMGESQTASRSAADTVSQNLKDVIKSELGWFCEQAKYKLLKELFQEAPFQLSVQNAVRDVSVEFHEIDAESQIKTETHAINTFNQNGITQTELRRKLKLKPLTEEQKADTNHKLHVESLVNAKASASGNNKLAKKKAAKKKSAGAKISGTQTKVQPENQHGKNTGPHKAKSSSEEVSTIFYDQLMILRDSLDQDGLLNSTSWREYSQVFIDETLASLNTVIPSGLTQAIKNSVTSSFDPDVLLVLVSDAFSEWEIIEEAAA